MGKVNKATGKVVLLVEDDDMLGAYEERPLREGGFETKWTDATDVARGYLDDGGIDLLILDVDELRKEPKGTRLREEGLRFLRKLRGDPRYAKEKLPVIGTTRHLPTNSGSWEKEFLDAGGDVFLEQPVDLVELVSTVRRLLSIP